MHVVAVADQFGGDVVARQSDVRVECTAVEADDDRANAGRREGPPGDAHARAHDAFIGGSESAA